MFNENVYVLIKDENHFNEVKEAFVKLGYENIYTLKYETDTFYIRGYVTSYRHSPVISSGNKEQFNEYCNGYKQVFLINKK